MEGEASERFRQLCQQAASERDHETLMRLVQEINAILDEKEKRLDAKKQGAA